MSQKRICINPVLEGVSGDIKDRDEHGHVKNFRFRYFSPTGKPYFGLGTAKKRNYSLKPLTQKEIAHRALFQQALASKKAIRMDMQKRNQWIQRWRDETDPELTAATFNGYLMKMGMKGHISAEGEYQE